MRNTHLALAASIFMTSLFLLAGCTEPDDTTPVTPEEESTCYFIYDGYHFDINSAVRYEKGDNSVEIWLSPLSGLTTSEAIQNAGDYVVLNTHVTYLGKRDRFEGATSKNSYLKFTDLEFAYGDKGTAYIEADIIDGELILNFLAEVLRTKDSPVPAIMLKGEYKGTFVTETESRYSNEWGFDRERTGLSSAVYTTREDGGYSSVTMIDENGNEAVTILMSPENIKNKSFTFTATDKVDGLRLEYLGGADFDLDDASGTIMTKITEDGNLEASVDVLKNGKQLRAQYSGAYVKETVKTNRYIYDYKCNGSFEDNSYEGKHDILKFMISGEERISFYFSPTEGYTVGSVNSTHMPILTVPASVINDGKKLFKDIAGWEFAFDMMQVWPYADEFRPHPADTDWIEINHDGDTYEIEFILSGNASGMDSSSIDVYYKGEARR